MITVTASKLRQHLFEYLKQVSDGETLVVKRNQREVARIIPAAPAGSDWRQQMKVVPEIKVPVEELIQPMTDIWEDYI